MWKGQYKYKISSTEYEVNMVIDASKYIKQGDIVSYNTLKQPVYNHLSN
jgi:hypothetical protein